MPYKSASPVGIICNKLIDILENHLEKKFDFIEITKKLDQFSLLKKLLLNEGQCLILESRELKIIKSSSNARGKRLREGFQISQGRIILLHHPRSYLEREGIDF